MKTNFNFAVEEFSFQGMSVKGLALSGDFECTEGETINNNEVALKVMTYLGDKLEQVFAGCIEQEVRKMELKNDLLEIEGRKARRGEA